MVGTITVIAATLVIQQTTAISWISQAFKANVQNLQPSLPIVRPIDTRKRWIKHDTFRNDIVSKEQLPTNTTTANATESVSVSTETSLSWIDQTMARVVSIITYYAIGESIIHLLHANRSEIATEVSLRYIESAVTVIKQLCLNIASI
jgi:hypothetical protein